MNNTYYIRDAATVSRRIGDETVLVPVRQNIGDLESIYTLNGVAAALWDRLEAPQTVEALAASLAAEYEVTPPQAASDVQAFLAEMASLRLVEVQDHV
ncbi:MAG: PqqD family protein [Armatimonadetes bacterium]|nr:PqqD family protein [Armatimonadota bacterium]